jgi:hypothetical protein
MGGSPSEPPVIPRYADVWDVLDHILNKTPLEHDAKIEKQKSNEPKSGAMGGSALMS